MQVPQTYKAVRLHPTERVIQVETLPCPQIEHPDDAIVKVILAGLCGSDLHAYRGHEIVPQTIVTGHEFVGEVVALGSNYSSESVRDNTRPALYSNLKVGDKVIAPFTTSCGECQFCRIGFSARCVHSTLFGCVDLPGAQAQYVRVPFAGGTLFVVSNSPASAVSPSHLATLADTSLLLLADILPTGYFTALQALQHPNIVPLLNGKSYPFSALENLQNATPLTNLVRPAAEEEIGDRVITLAVIGLGPVGVCAVVSLLDLLATLGSKYRIVAVDLNTARKEKIIAIYNALPASARGNGEFATASPAEAKQLVNEWTDGIGCNAVLEIVGNSPALKLAYDLVRPFGFISSTGVHQDVPFPLTGWACFDKNISISFGRCPVRAIFPLATDLLHRRQDVFGLVGTTVSLVDRVMSIDDAPEAYRLFDSGESGKILFDPWK